MSGRHYSVKITDPSGHSFIIDGTVKAAEFLGLSWDTLNKLAKGGGFTRTGHRVEYVDSKSRQRKQVCLSIHWDLYDRLAAEAERQSTTPAAIAKVLLEEMIAARVPLLLNKA